MSEDDKYTRFIKVCQESLNNRDIWNTFRQNWNYTYMLEQHWDTTEYIGIRFIQVLKEKYGDLLKELPWKVYLQNDTIGGPRLHNYKDLETHVYLQSYYMTHTTLRYICFSLDIITYLRSVSYEFNSLSIVEIGGGYGGQCKILIDTLRHFYPHLKLDYTIIDLEDVSKMQHKYLNELGYKDVSCSTSMNYKKNRYDLCISTFTIGEIGVNHQNDYIRNIILKCPYTYMIWNHSPINSLLYSRDIEIQDEYPSFEGGNHILTFL